MNDLLDALRDIRELAYSGKQCGLAENRMRLERIYYIAWRAIELGEGGRAVIYLTDTSVTIKRNTNES